jgi:hypothetical protein
VSPYLNNQQRERKEGERKERIKKEIKTDKEREGKKKGRK